MYPGTHAERQPDKAAVVMAASGETVTYRQLDQRSNRLAALLWDRGLRPGDAIAFSLENNARFFEVVWAAQRSGLYSTPVTSRLTADETAYIVADCGAKVLVASAARPELADALTHRLPAVG